MSSIDWSNAPSWATAVMKNWYGALFFAESFGTADALAEKVDGNDSSTFMANFGPGHGWTLVEKRPVATTWDGEGLPPVGANVESKEFGGVTVLAHGVFRGQTAIVCQGNDTIVTASVDQLRPFRSAEQIAVAAQEAAISDLADTLSRTAYGQTPRDYARAAVLAGYRKP